MAKKGLLRWACVVCLAQLVSTICHAQTLNPDQPNNYGSNPTRFSTTQFVSHRCRHKSPDDIARVLRPLLPKTGDIQLVVDRDQSRLLLSGPENVQAMALRVVEALDQPREGALGAGLEQNSSSPGMANQTSINPSSRTSTGVLPRIAPPREATPISGDRQRPPERVLNQFVFVPRARMGRVQQQLSAIFANRLQVRRIGEREVFLLTTATQGRSILELEYDSARSGVLIGGPEAAVQQLARIVHTLASDAAGQQMRAKVFRVHRKNHSAVQEMVRPPSQLRGDSSSIRPPDRGVQPAGAQLGGVQRGGVERRGVQAASGVAPARYLYQERGSEAAGGQVPPVGQQERPAPRAIDELPLRQFEGVEVESLPDLDVIILRGSDKELEQLAEIIQQLERISRETQPHVEIYHLRYANGEAVADLVAESSPDLVDTRAGRVSLMPLVKPNAIMIIGWGDAVQAVLQLIRQLDKPVSPQSQSTVFRIRHAPAGQVQETLESFFGSRDGLGPRINTAVDLRTNSLIVHAAPRDMDEVRRIVEEIDRPDSSAVNRAHVFRIEHALAADVAATLQQAIDAAGGNGDRSAILELQTFDAEGQRILRSGTLENIQVTPNPRNNTVIVSSPPANLELIGALIEQLDTPGAQSQIKVFRIVNGQAAGLVETLRSLLPSGAVGPQLPSAPGETSLAPLRFSVDVRSNSVIATGSEGDLRIVEALLLKLDQSNTLQRKTHVYQLKNSPAVDVANAVNQFLVGQRQVERAAPGSESPFQELEKEVVVVPEPVANKLVLSATPRYFDEISTLIEKLDEQPPQVMIQVLIAEVALNNTDEFGVELGLQDSVLFDRSLLGDLLTTTNTTQTSTPAGIVTTTEEIIRAATNLPGFAFNNVAPLGNSGSTSSFQRADVVGGQGVSNFSVGRGNDQLGFGGLVLSASSRNVNVLLRALQESRRVDVLSRPQIRTLDNQPAFIQVGQRVPRIIGSSVNQNGQSNSVALENVGLIMAVTPRISPEGNVVMEIDAEKSSLGPEQDGVPVAVSVDGTVVRSPRIDTTTAQTTVSAANGETIVLGGLITENKEEFHRQVPWLGDLPLLGQLFRYDGTVARRSELIIILTPRVIRSTEESDRIRQTEMARMSWCAADVFELHGDVGMMATHSAESLDNAAPQVIYPDLNPTGDVFPAIPQSQQEVPPVTFQQ